MSVHVVVPLRIEKTKTQLEKTKTQPVCQRKTKDTRDRVNVTKKHAIIDKFAAQRVSIAISMDRDLFHYWT